MIRLALAFGTSGVVFDLNSSALVDNALRLSPLHVYALVNHGDFYRWPYPSGFFPVILVTGSLSHHAGIAFTKLIRVSPILADAAIAWVVQDFLRWRGASESVRFAAAATIALGPLFIAISSYNGQIDSLAILPAVIAVAIWDRLESWPRLQPWPRWLVAGILIGVGCAIKSVPLLMVLVLLPSCRSLREGTLLLATAVTVPLLLIAPFLVSDAHAVLDAFKYRSLVGQGGISLLVQPDLARMWLGSSAVQLSGVSAALQGTAGSVIGLGALAAATAAVLRFRAWSVDAAVLIWLTVFAFGINFSPRYAIWGLPFFLMAGKIRQSLALQAVLIRPTILLFATPAGDVAYAYVPLMLLAWAGAVGGIVIVVRRLGRRGNPVGQCSMT